MLHLGRLADATEVPPAPIPADHPDIPAISTCLASVRAYVVRV